MMASTLSLNFSLADFRVPATLSISTAGALFLFHLMQPGNAIPVHLVLASLLSLVVAWATGVGFLSSSQRRNDYMYTAAGLLSYVLLISASAVWIGVQELALGVSGGAAFVILAGTLTPILAFSLYILQNFRQLTE